MNNCKSRFLCAATLSLFLISCSQNPKPQTYFGDSILSSSDSVKVKAAIYVSQSGKGGITNEKLSAVLFAVPNERYRLELSGTLGFSAASILWKPDGWLIVMPQEKRYKEGVGNCVSVPIYGSVDIHKFFSLFWGQKAETISCLANAALPPSAQNLIPQYKDNAAIIVNNGDSLKIEIKSIDGKAEWKTSIWNLPIPDGYILVR